MITDQYIDIDDIDEENNKDQNKKENFNGYNLISILGKGVSGTVWKAKRTDGKIVALKIVNDYDNPKKLNRLIKEVEILEKISNPTCHPFLVCFNGYAHYPSSYFLIEMDLVEGSNLDKYSRSYRLKDPTTLYKHLLLIMKDIVKALSYLHQNSIIHKDIKPDNIIIENDLTPVLVDFGVSCFADTCNNGDNDNKCCHDIMGPVLYTSPESIRTKSSFYSSDVWAMGVTFYVAATGSVPFNIPDFKNGLKILDIIKDEPIKELHTSNKSLNFIVNRCLDKNPKTRITLDEINKLLMN